jgi:hypothetical protein
LVDSQMAFRTIVWRQHQIIRTDSNSQSPFVKTIALCPNRVVFSWKSPPKWAARAMSAS